jgi:hypothetical protein
MALAIGWARRGPGQGFSAWYYDLAVLVLCCTYLIGVVYYEETYGHLLQLGLLLLVCTFLIGNFQEGLNHARAWQLVYGNFEKDVLSGMPLDLLIDRYGSKIGCFGYESSSIRAFEARARVAEDLAVLRRAGIGVYRYLRDDMPMNTISLTVPKVDTNEFTRGAGVGYGFSGDPYLDFRLAKPLLVYALRVTCSMNSTGKGGSFVTFQASWKNGDDGFNESGEDGELCFSTFLGRWRSAVWINDRIDRLRVYTSGKKDFDVRIESIELLTSMEK